MGIDKKILSEIDRYRQINRYIMEQEAPDEEIPVPGADLGALAPPAGGVEAPPAPAGATPPPPPAEGQPIDVETDNEV